jgi:feruloyl esterase
MARPTRQANMEAWRYPDDFDGIISGCPHPDVAGTVMMEVWMALANTGPDGRNLITPAEAELVAKAVNHACDSLDGLEDGLISDPGACQFDLARLACKGHQAAGCLTANQINTLKAFYGGPRDSAGQQLFPGVPYGSEPYWDRWITGQTADVSDDFVRRTGMEFMRYMAFLDDPGEQYSPANFDFDRDPQRLRPMAQIYHANNPDLDKFRERGGKLLMWHAWGDAAVPATRAMWYYEAVEGHVGSRESTQDFFRLFLVPGMDHCGIEEGPGNTQHGFDPLTALERWVEHGEAPTSLLTTKTDSTGNVIWTRPVCPYPQRAVYDGDGDVNDASNFECVDQD